MIRAWLHRRRCMHHNWRTGETWIKSTLIEFGMVKLIWCDRCGKDF